MPASTSLPLRLLRGLGWIVALLYAFWATAAMWFVHPVAAVAFIVLSGGLAWRIRRRSWAPVASLASTGAVMAGWSALPPRNDRTWSPDTAELAWSEIKGDAITLHNFRHFDWRSETDFTPRWETRTFRLSQLGHLDFLITYWGSPHFGHTMVTFDFGPDGRVCASIEARREQGEEYSAFAGMFRRYELVYVLGDERDVVRLRTNIRPNNEVYLFRLHAKSGVVQAMFLDYLRSINALRERAEWYDTLTTNCSTTIREHVRRANVSDPWDWRMLANGHIDERLYDFGYVARDLPLPELKRRSQINAAAHAADRAPDFSDRIRVGLPGF